jgi:hypothetical protein
MVIYLSPAKRARKLSFMLPGSISGFEIFYGFAETVYSIKVRYLDFANARAYKFKLSDVWEER